MSIEQQIRDYLTRSLGRDLTGSSDDQSMLESGTIDSIGMLSLVEFIEEEFGVAVSEDEMMPENFDTIHAMASFVRRRQAGG